MKYCRILVHKCHNSAFTVCTMYTIHYICFKAQLVFKLLTFIVYRKHIKRALKLCARLKAASISSHFSGLDEHIICVFLESHTSQITAVSRIRQTVSDKHGNIARPKN